MRIKLFILTIVFAVIVSFSFISIDKKQNNDNSGKMTNKAERPLAGFALEDENQF